MNTTTPNTAGSSDPMADTIARFLQLARTLDTYVSYVDGLPADPVTGQLPFTEATVNEVLLTGLTAAREACDLIVGAYTRLSGATAGTRRP